MHFGRVLRFLWIVRHLPSGPTYCVFTFAGIWIRDIRSKSNLPLTQLNKVLKNLENKELIKAVKSVAVSAGSSQVNVVLVFVLLNR